MARFSLPSLQKRMLVRLLPLPAVVAGALVFQELSGPRGWAEALAWALGAGAAAAGAFAAYFRWNEARKAVKAREAEDREQAGNGPPDRGRR